MTECELDHIICKKCGIVEVFPLPKMEIYDDYYKNSFPFDYPLMDERQKFSYNFLKNYLDGKKGTIFDIGAGHGYFLSHFKQDGWTCSGVEINSKLVNEAKKKYGINIINSKIEAFQSTMLSQNYDLVTFSHVLEHLFNPGKIFEQIKNLLNNEGLLYIEVPSIEMASKHEGPVELMAFTHIRHFSEVSLAKFLESHGFRKIQIKTTAEKNIFVLRGLFQKSSKNLNEFNSRTEINKEDFDYAKNCFLTLVKKREQKKIQALNKIKKLSLTTQPIVFYGAGEDMFDILTSNPNIVQNNYLVDSNPNKWGKTIRNVKILNPEIISELDNPIICVTSRAFTIQDSIVRSIEELPKNNQNIVQLFE